MNPNANHLAALLAAGCASAPSAADMAPKPATQTTVSANQAMRPVGAAFDKRDLDDATRGKLAELVKVEGNPQGFGAVVANIVEFPPLFNIVTP